MKQFKAIDLILQIILIPIGIIGTLVNPDSMFLAYGIVGIWQVTSAIIHGLFSQKYIALKARKYYGLIVGVLIIGALLFMNGTDTFIYYGFMLLIVSPFLAIWYAWICYTENKKLESDQHTN